MEVPISIVNINVSSSSVYFGNKNTFYECNVYKNNNNNNKTYAVIYGCHDNIFSLHDYFGQKNLQ